MPFLRILSILLVSMASSLAQAQNASPSPDLKSVQALRSDPQRQDYYAQVLEALQKSDSIKKKASALKEAGKPLKISVMPAGELPAPKGKLFGGFIAGDTMVFSYDFLKSFRSGRIHDVVYDDDVAPDHTVFAIAHLLHHLETKDAFSAEKYGKYVEAHLKARLDDEASAWIFGWNSLIEAATNKNGGKALTQRQVTQLLMDFQYRSILFKAMKVGPSAGTDPNALDLLPSGSIDDNRRNIDAIVEALKSSQLANIE